MFLRNTLCIGRAIAEAVSRWLPTAAARVQSRVWSSEICGGQSGAGAGFVRVRQKKITLKTQATLPFYSILISTEMIQKYSIHMHSAFLLSPSNRAAGFIQHFQWPRD
jgi:hypothetical protein